METQRNLATVAASMLDAGLCVLPARCDQKRPSIPWKLFQSRLPRRMEVDAWFANGHKALCLVTGAVSGNLELLDFDLGGELFEPWSQRVQEKAPGLLDRLVVETTPSNGWHVAYRCQSSVSGNLKLAQRCITVSTNDPVSLAGKQYVPRRDGDGNFHIVLTLIETRGEGGLFLCDPSPGYELIQGDFSQLPVLTSEERDLLLEAAWSLTEYVPEPATTGSPQGEASANPAEGRPGDDYNERGNLRALLTKHGWTQARSGDNELWCRPGKTSGWSATLKDRVFYVFSSSAAPFEPNRAYSPFHVYALLETNGDFASASSALRQEGFGGDLVGDSGVDLSGLIGPLSESPRREPSPYSDPGTLPSELLRVPGLVSEVMDFCLETAPYPNVALSFCGALALQSLLGARKVRDPADNRTNIYLLGLAHSAAGKDAPRKLNVRILHGIGMGICLGERFASGEGIWDALIQTPSILFQTDEIDGLLQQVNKSKDARHENIINALLNLYTTANSMHIVRKKANIGPGGSVDQPCVSLFGTAIPNHYYEALSERLLTNGFFARMLIVESGPRGEGQEPRICDVPERIMETAKWWADYKPGEGDLSAEHPTPAIIPIEKDGLDVLIEARKQADQEYSKAQSRNDVVATTVWGRVNEQCRKLALLYAISANHLNPKIDHRAAEWAIRFVNHQTHRMLFMAQTHVADNPFHAECLRLMGKLREARGQRLMHSVLLKRMKLDMRSFREIIMTLIESGDIVSELEPSSGRTGTYYRLIEGRETRVKEGEE